MADTQLTNLSGVVRARLERATAGSCASVVLYSPPHRQNAAQCPILYAYRASEKLERWGTGGKIGRNATVKILYVLKPTGEEHLEDAQGVLSWAVEMITDAILHGRDENYASGAKLETLAAIEEMIVDDVAYNLDMELPQVEITVRVRHKWTREPGDKIAIEEFVGSLDLNAGLDALELVYGDGKRLYLWPLRHGVYLTAQTGVGLAVEVEGLSVTLTCVVGETTLAGAAAAVAASAAAAALLEITGDDGILYDEAGPSLTLALSRPLARQRTTVD